MLFNNRTENFVITLAKQNRNTKLLIALKEFLPSSMASSLLFGCAPKFSSIFNFKECWSEFCLKIMAKPHWLDSIFIFTRIDKFQFRWIDIWFLLVVLDMLRFSWLYIDGYIYGCMSIVLCGWINVSYRKFSENFYILKIKIFESKSNETDIFVENTLDPTICLITANDRNVISIQAVNILYSILSTSCIDKNIRIEYWSFLFVNVGLAIC